MLSDVADKTAAVLGTLTTEQWNSPSLCSQWTIREVAGHLVSGTSTPMRCFTTELVRARGNFHHANAADASRVAADQSPPHLVSAIAAGTIGGVGRLLPRRLLLADHVVHLLDIANALQITVALPPDILAAVLTLEVSIPNPFVPAARLARGLSIEASDTGWRRNRSGPAIRGNATDLISALAGRPAALSRLDGPGARTLQTRICAQIPEYRGDIPSNQSQPDQTR